MAVGGNTDIKNDRSDIEDITFPVGNATQMYNDVNITEQLTQEQKEQVPKMLSECIDVVTDIPGMTNLIQHEIKLLSSDPDRSKGYTIPFKTSEVVERCQQ